MNKNLFSYWIRYSITLVTFRRHYHHVGNLIAFPYRYTFKHCPCSHALTIITLFVALTHPNLGTWDVPVDHRLLANMATQKRWLLERKRCQKSPEQSENSYFLRSPFLWNRDCGVCTCWNDWRAVYLAYILQKSYMCGWK